jgi:protoporphyrinogen IX oxidase
MAWLKFVHVGAIAVWCAGLLYLTALIPLHRRDLARGEFIGLRRATRFTHVVLLAPGAALAIATGTALLFVADALHGWMFLKLAAVGGLVIAQLGLGSVARRLAEPEESPPRWLGAVAIPTVLGSMLAILWLVLAEPDVDVEGLPPMVAEPGGLQDWVSRVTPIRCSNTSFPPCQPANPTDTNPSTDR